MSGIPRLPGALCAQDDATPETWFAAEHQREAVRLCRTCPALIACRKYADEVEAKTPPRWWIGIWAGETPGQRHRRRKREAS